MADLGNYTPVLALRGKVVHALSYTRPGRSVCDRRSRRWRVSADRAVECEQCLLGILYAQQQCRRRRQVGDPA